MKTQNFSLHSGEMIDATIFETYRDKSNLLVQIFFGPNDNIPYLHYLLQSISEHLPQAVVIGATTSGEIFNRSVLNDSVIISLTHFTKTSLKAAYRESSDDYVNGQELAYELLNDKSKLMLCFTDGTTGNGEAFLKGINDVNQEVIVAGGMAADNETFTQTYVYLNNKIIQSGAVAVVLDSEDLIVHNGYSFDWQALGNAMTITEVKGNRVFTIDGQPAVDIYEKYLGRNTKELLPNIGIEFPLIVSNSDYDYARAVLATHDDGSLSFAGDLHLGDTVHMGFSNANYILENSLQHANEFLKHPVESIFVYSCMARKRFMSEEINTEIEALAHIAPTVGFFTYGEFYKAEKKSLLFNESITVVSLSETAEVVPKLPFSQEEGIESSHAKTIKALSHLFQISHKELQSNQNILEKAMNIANIGYFTHEYQTSSFYASSSAKAYLNLPFAHQFFEKDYLKKTIHPLDKKVLDKVNQAIQEEQPYQTSCRIHSKEGYKHLLITVEHQYDEYGTLVTSIGTINDFTDLIQIEEDNKALAFLVSQAATEIYIFSRETLKPIYASQSALNNLGFELSELTKSAVTTLFKDMTPDRVKETIKHLQESANVSMEAFIIRKDGSSYPLSMLIQATQYHAEDVFVVFGTDISKEYAQRKELESLQSTLQSIMDNSPTFMMVITPQKVLSANKPLLHFLGYDSLETFNDSGHFLWQQFQAREDYFHLKSYTDLEDFYEACDLFKEASQKVLLLEHLTRKEHVMRITMDHLPGEQKLISLTDITDIEEEKQLQTYLATHDGLTKIYNRRYFEETFKQYKAQAVRQNQLLSIVMLDIDNFKEVNDNYGHIQGDEVLKRISHYISQHTRKSDIFARWGGEEFVILLYQTELSKAFSMASQFQKAIEAIKHPDIGQVTCSFGVATLHKNDTVDTLISRADEALYEAKHRGKNQVRLQD